MSDLENLPAAIVEGQLIPSRKGKDLEAAVALIEELILRTSSSLRDKPFVIEKNKIIVINGVHHEIDIFVTIEVAEGYKSIFIFECKNWEERVEKNEIIVFETKINAAQAQHGYFVAKSFTKDAEAQARSNTRISLLKASDHDPKNTLLPATFNGIIIEPTAAKAEMYARATVSGVSNPGVEKSDTTYRGNPINLRTYLDEWTNDVVYHELNSLPFEMLEPGAYNHSGSSTRHFGVGELLTRGRDIEHIKIAFECRYRVIPLVVTSHFEVETRGRVISVATPNVEPDDGITLQLIWH